MRIRVIWCPHQTSSSPRCRRVSPANDHPKAQHELFQSTVKIITGVCGTPTQARADLAETFQELHATAARRGLKIISAGTHPFGLARNQDVSPNPRYHELVEAMQ